MTTPEIAKAVKLLRSGEVVGFPTETVYGLGADANNADAVAKIYQLKGRPQSHPLIVHIASADDLANWAVNVPEAAFDLASALWPGPLTLVLQKHPSVLDAVTAGLDTVGLRVPAHPTALDLIVEFGGGVAAPSANRFGAVSPTRAEHVRDEFADEQLFVLDGGECSVGVESTIVRVVQTNRLEILRPGGVPIEEIESISGIQATLVYTDDQAQPQAPGMLPSHYSPRANVIICDANDLYTTFSQLSKELGRNVAILAPSIDDDFDALFSRELGEDQESYARSMYDAMREVDRRGLTLVVIVPPPDPERGLGPAICDRLKRASSDSVDQDEFEGNT